MLRAAFLFSSFLLLFSSNVPAQQKPAEHLSNLPPTAPTAGARMEFLDGISYFEQRFERLAEAIPPEKYGWRPVEGVRTIGEVYLHVVAMNYNVAKMLGTPMPAGVDTKAMMAYVTDKPKVIQALKDSFAQLRTAVIALKDSELDKEMKTPRGQTTMRGMFFIISGQLGEHLGQSIVYARSVGVVPPWTEERQRQEADKPNHP
jgi:uncharacterized damage-inducible protein DinB